MEINNIYLVYFSATQTTRKISKLIADQLGGAAEVYNITRTAPQTDVLLTSEDLLIVAMPVYAGRIPALSVARLARFKGDNTPVVIVAVYGNRDYDDALIEMKDLVEGNGCKVVSAGAFIARHSIFPKVAADRPDEKDIQQIRSFADQTYDLLQSLSDIHFLSEIRVKGDRPYKIPGKIPLYPKGNQKCNECGTCVRLCPVGAIPADAPRKTLKKKCISCAHCVASCTEGSRHFGGLFYQFAGMRFAKANSLRKEPEMVFAKVQ